MALVVAALSGTAAPQEYRKLKVKPSHANAEKEKKGGEPVKMGTSKAPASQELLRVEKESSRTAVAQKAAARRQARVTPAMKPQKEPKNPTIHFSSTAGGGRGGANKKNSNPYKGRVRQKGSR